MEYIQTVLLQVDASRLEQASQSGGLLSELDEHRAFLKQQPGFRDLRITRSINAEGSVLIVIETRWSDDASLVHYETHEPNVAAIVNGHSSIIVSGSLQVLDMEALRTDASWRPMEQASAARARLTLPLLIPVGVLSFILLVVYGLSRVYLEIQGDGATALAAGIAIGILIIAFYLASARNVPGWQIAGIFVVAAGVLTGGAVWALSEEDESEADEPAAEGPADETPAGESPGGAEVILMDDNFFALTEGGEENPTLSVVAGEETTLQLENAGGSIHNMRIAGADGEFSSADDAVSDPAIVSGGEKATITFTLDAGVVRYQCDFHPDAMKGTIEAE